MVPPVIRVPLGLLALPVRLVPLVLLEILALPVRLALLVLLALLEILVPRVL